MRTGPARVLWPQPRIAAVVCDIDGTLLTSRHTLTNGVREAVQAAVRGGARFLLASARPPAGIVYLYDQLGIPAEPYVALNGALVMSARGGRLRRAVMPGPAAIGVLDLAASCGLTCNGFVDGRWLASTRDGWVAEEERATGCTAEVVGDLRPYGGEDFEKISLMGPLGRIRAFEIALRSRFDLFQSVAAVRSNPCYLEVTSRAASKQVAVLWLLGRLGIRPEAAMAIGDGMNDIEIIQALGLGVALAHAAPAVRAAARAVAPSNDDDGVAHALRTWVQRDTADRRGGGEGR